MTGPASVLPRLPWRLPETTRRIFLKRSLQGLGALAVLPCFGPVACAPERGPAAGELQVLAPAEHAILAAAADAFVPRGGVFALGASDLQLAARIDAYLAQADPELVDGVRAALLLLEWGGGLLAGRLGRFSRLDAAARAAVLAALPQRFGLARQVYAGLKQLCLFCFYAAEESWPALGYDGPWIGRRVAAR